jgi:hypothetical protein
MMSSINLWHQRLGHPNNKTLPSILREVSSSCNNYHHDHSPYESCQAGRKTRVPSLYLI